MQFPLVSICLPTFNGERYLEEALDSVSKQSYPNLELIISDDQSFDRTISIIEHFGQNHNVPVKLYHHPSKGIGANWNYCIKKAEGKYIKFLFQDDQLDPECVSKMVEVFENSETELGFVYCNKLLIGDSSPIEQQEVNDHFNSFKEFTSEQFLSSPKLYEHPRNKIGEPPAVMLRASVFEGVKPFNEQLEQGLDYECWCRILTKNQIQSLDEALIKFRIHDKQTSKLNSQKIVVDSYLIPWLMLINLFSQLNNRVKITLINKLIRGFALYHIIRPIKGI